MAKSAPALLAGGSVEQFADSIGMPAVTSRLVDQVKKHPAQTNVPLTLQLTGVVQRSRSHKGVRHQPPLLVRANGRVDRQLLAGLEFGLIALNSHSEEATVDPAPLDVGQMVDDPDQTQQTFLGTPMGILIAHRCLSDDGAPKEAEPVQEQLLLIVGVIDGEAMVGHPNRVGGLLSLLLGERVSLNESSCEGAQTLKRPMELATRIGLSIPSASTVSLVTTLTWPGEVSSTVVTSARIRMRESTGSGWRKRIRS